MSTLKLDNLYVHQKNLGDKVGEFCGSPIVELYTHDVEVDQVVDVVRTIEINRKGTPVSTVEVLPGEIICEDNIVRRATTAEAVGIEFYNNYEIPAETTKIPVVKARQLAKKGALVTFRPNRVVGQEEFALLHGEEA